MHSNKLFPSHPIDFEETKLICDDDLVKCVYESDNICLIRYNFKAGTVLFTTSSYSDNCVTSYHVIRGILREVESKRTLTEGSTVVYKYVEDIISLYVLEDTLLVGHIEGYTSFWCFHRNNYLLANLLNKIDDKGSYIKLHSERVADLVTRMAVHMGYCGRRLYCLKHAALLHDIGKVKIDNNILKKRGVLSQKEFESIKSHASIGQSMILELFDETVYNIVIMHHERLDGTGYPNGLYGDKITEEARILAICDSYDAMITDRVYKKGKSQYEALNELRQLSPLKYDIELVEIFINMFTEYTVS